MAEKRRPRLPMMLGLTVLTAMSHVLVAAIHLTLHPVGDWPLLVLLAAAPIVGVAVIMNGRPRHGAAIVAVTMIAAAFWTLYAHYIADGDFPDTKFYAGVVQMLLAFELQGMAAGLILIVKPEVPRPRDAAPAS